MSDKVRYYPKAHEVDDCVIGVKIERIPRWKESELSGDEWRFALNGVVTVKDWANGGTKEIVVPGGRWSSIEVADLVAAWLHEHRSDLGPPYQISDLADLRCCFQPGCGEAPVVCYLIKQEWTWFPHQGRRMESPMGGPSVRAFCGRHRHRGDCGLEDNDANYEEVTVAAPEGRVSVEAIAPIIKAELDWGTDGIITPDYVDIALAAARMVVAWINGETK